MVLEIAGLLVFGFIVGGYGTLVGIGGGPLIVPFLMLFYQYVPVDIIATSLMVILFNVVAGSYFYYRQGRIDIVSGTKMGLVAIPGALLGTLITHFFTIGFLRTVFGLLLLGLGVYVFATSIVGAAAKAQAKVARNRAALSDEDDAEPQKPRDRFPDPNEKLTKRVMRDSAGQKYVFWFNEKMALIISAIVGFIGPLIGIGGGVFHVPAMTEILKFPTHIATATVHYVLLICVFFALIPYITMGAVHYDVAIPMGIGTIFGARLGAKLSAQYSSEVLFKLLSIGLFLLSIRLLFFP
jgi:uncharacterized membrane protein YfcA